MTNITDADKILRNDTGKDIVDKLEDIVDAIGAEDNTYTKTESDEKFATKTSLSEVATTGDYNDLNNKPSVAVIDDTTKVADKVWSSKKTYEEIVNILPTGNASGSIANFNTSLALPLVSAKFDVNATQEAGTPTPSEPKAISGVSAVNLVNQNDKADIFRNLLLGNYGFIELNSFNWTRNTFSGIDYFTTNTVIPNVKGISFGVLGNEFTNKYTTIKSNGVQSSFVDKTCFLWSSKVFYVRDDDYTTATTFKNSLSGVYLIYELETPVTPTITKAQFDTLLTAFGINGTTQIINLGGTYYGGQVEIDKNGSRKFKVTHTITTIDGTANIGVSSSSYIKSDACDGFVYNDNIEPRVHPTVQPDHFANCDKLTPIKSAIWNTVGYPNCMTINANQIHLNIANTDLGVTDYTQETTTSIKAKIEAFLANNPITVVFMTTPYYIDLADGEPINSLVGVNNVYADSGNSEVVYKKSIDDAIAELQALILNA